MALAGAAHDAGMLAVPSPHLSIFEETGFFVFLQSRQVLGVIGAGVEGPGAIRAVCDTRTAADALFVVDVNNAVGFLLGGANRTDWNA